MRICILLAAFLIPLTHSNASSLNEQLAELGHPNTKTCVLPKSSQGLGKLLVIQFENKNNRKENQQETIALLKKLVRALNEGALFYVGFEATKKWDTCKSRDPEYIYWRDYDNNWRYVRDKPVAYLTQIEADLTAELRGTPAEAFVLFSLGLVEQRLNRIPASVRRFEKAYDLLRETDDPNAIKAFLLAPLIQYHFGDEGVEEKGQAYLLEYALVAKNSPVDKANYVPLIKVAPVYPYAAQQSGRQGYVVLEFTVDIDGKVQNPIVIEESPKGVFGDAAIEAAKYFRYIPAVVDSVRVPTEGVRNRITFELR